MDTIGKIRSVRRPRKPALSLGRPSAASVVGALLWVGALLGGVPLQASGQLPAQIDRDRVPVLLIPGWGDEATDLAPLRDQLLREGWPPAHLLALTFEDPFGGNAGHALEIARSVELLRRLSGAEEVDLIAHSMGGLATRWYLQEMGGTDQVRRVVFLATPHRGTVAAILAWGDGGREMAPGSDFLTRINRAPPDPGLIEMLSLRTPMDLRIIPGSSAVLPGAINLEICCPTHSGIAEDPRALEVVIRFLLEGPEPLHARDQSIPLRGGLGVFSR